MFDPAQTEGVLEFMDILDIPSAISNFKRKIGIINSQ